MHATSDVPTQLTSSTLPIGRGALRGSGRGRKHPVIPDAVLVGSAPGPDDRQLRRFLRDHPAVPVLSSTAASAAVDHLLGEAARGSGPWPWPTLGMDDTPTPRTNELDPEAVLLAIGATDATAALLADTARRRGIAAPGIVRVAEDRLDAAPPLPSSGTVGVLVGPLDADPFALATWLLHRCVEGIPVVGELGDELEALVGPGVAELVTDTAPATLLDPHAAELHGVRLRRRALAERSSMAAWSAIGEAIGRPVHEPSVSVLLATNRPEELPGAVERFRSFTYGRKELLVGLHGFDLAASERQALGPGTGDVRLVSIDASLPLGTVLQHLSDLAGGEVLSKMDDDDLYGPDHLTDLVLGLATSGATLVGKGSEFVYLQEIDTTIRRFRRGAHSPSRNLAGGTLAITRDHLRAVGGWQPAPRAVDQRLMDDVVVEGGSIHRTHGFGFVLFRRASGHTWDTDSDYFLRQSWEQWPGLAREQADVGPA